MTPIDPRSRTDQAHGRSSGLDRTPQGDLAPMLKSLARKILFRGPSRRILSSQILPARLAIAAQAVAVWDELRRRELGSRERGVVGPGVALSSPRGVPAREPGRYLRRRPHNGSYSLNAARIFGSDARVHSFEPSAAVYKSLLATRGHSSGRTKLYAEPCCRDRTGIEDRLCIFTRRAGVAKN